MKIYLKTIFLSFLLFLFCSVVGARAVQAGSLKFDKATVNVNADETFQVQVIVDAGSDEITSVDSYITFDGNILQAQSVSQGTFFPTVFNDITTSRVYVAGLVDDPATSKTGTGTVATVTFKALKSGTATLAYSCDPAQHESSKIIKNDIDATNVIACSQNGSSAVTVAGGSTTEPTVTPGGTSDSGSSGSTSTPSELPQSGVLDNIIQFAVPGVILVIIGVATKLLL